MGFYGEKLAHIHATAFAGTFAAAYPWLENEVRLSASHPRLFDAGCGGGDWLLAAKVAGISACGVDRSRHFIAMARARGLEVAKADLCHAHLPEGTTAVTALGEVLAYQPAALWPFSEHVSRALPIGGVFLFDLVSPECTSRVFQKSGKDWHLVADISVSDRVLVRRIKIESSGGDIVETHRQTLFDAVSVEKRLKSMGLSVDLLTHYGPVAMLPGRFAIRAVKI